MQVRPDVFESIIIDMANGLTVKKALIKHGVSQYDFFKEMDDDPSKWIRYENAQKAKAHSFIDDIPDIADNETDVSKARIMIDARRYYSSKIVPARYGERLEINVTKTIDIKQALIDAKQRVIDINATPLLPMRDLDQDIKTQGVELTKQTDIVNTGYKPEIPLKNDDDIFS